MNMKYCFPISLVTIFLATSLTACSEDEEYTVSGDGSLTPLSFKASMSGAAPQTRAVDNKFDDGDILMAYFEHVQGSSSELVEVGMSPSLVSFRLDNPEMATVPETNPVVKETKDLTVTSVLQGTQNLLNDHNTLYWDDFSSSDKPIDKDGHALRVKYGYCYNGGAPISGQELNQTTGALGWAVAQDQTAGIKTYDLLWCTGTNGVSYVHDKTQRENMGITIPYTHAMSKITLVLTADEGFETEDPFALTTASLYGMNISGTVKAAEAEANRITSTSKGTGDDAGIIKMHQKEKTVATSTKKATCIFEALVIPTTVLDLNNTIAQIVNVEKNTYNVAATQDVLNAFAESTTDVTSVSLKPGYNYLINVDLDKQEQTIIAQITDWNTITVNEYKASITFSPDIKSSVLTGDEEEANTNATFHVWAAECDENGNPKTYTGPTLMSYNSGSKVWTNANPLYWKDGFTSYFFRGLGLYDANKDITALDPAAGNMDKATQGKDLLWATTSAHTGKNGDTTVKEYEAGDPINPRTGPVPMTFEHAMSKISVYLSTTSSGSADEVDLSGAKISIANIYDQGTIALENGEISVLNATTTTPILDYLSADATGEGNKLKEVIVIPQSLKTMADGTTARNGAVAFYNKSELTEIAGHTYVTSSLERINYTAAEANTYNAALTGHISTSDVKTPAEYYTDETEVAEKNATLDGAVKADDPIYYTYAEFIALTNAQISEAMFALLTDAQKTHTYTSVDDYYALTGNTISNDDFDSMEDAQKTIVCTFEQYQKITPAFAPFDSYTNDAFEAVENSQKQKGTYTEETANEHNAGLPGAVKLNDEKSPAVNYTEAEVNAYNATLDGAKKAGDLKEYNVISTSKEAKPGDIKDDTVANPKIVMLIMLADGTTYSVDLADCTPPVSDAADADIAWERGKHYTYTIELKKSDIKFRAMVKNWDPVEGHGNANLDWD